ncbi:MAG TPA: alpha/beta fold hydrolase [Anaerolineales bacterium]
MGLQRSHGYFASPPEGKGPGVLVLHAWWGLNDTIKAFCSRVARSGFSVFAPDLYHGKIAETIPEAEALVKLLNKNEQLARSEIEDAALYLAVRSGHLDNLAIVGFSLGAYYALEHSTSDPDHIRAVVVYYGTGGGMDFKKSRAAYLGHFAENDPFEPRAGVDELEQTIQKAGRPVTFHHYPGTGHWFAEPDRTDAYNKAAAELAWDRTLEFLRNPATS